MVSCHLTSAHLVLARAHLYCGALVEQKLRRPFFTVLQTVLSDTSGPAEHRLMAAECLGCVALACPTLVRADALESPPPQFSPSTKDSESNPRSMLNVIVYGLVKGVDVAVVEQLGDILKASASIPPPISRSD